MIKMTKTDIDTLSRLNDEGTKEYFAWLRHILTLSSGSLTLLVALQNQFLPAAAPQLLFLLGLSWFLFAASIILALFALAGSHLLQFHTASEYLKTVQNNPETNVAGLVTTPGPYNMLGRIVPWVFVSAVVALTLFGTMNLYLGKKTMPAIGDKQATISAPQSSK